MNAVWRDGELVDRSQATVAVDAAAVSYSHAVFDACRVVVAPAGERARLFGLATHLARFERSCRGLHLQLAYSAAELRGAALETIRRNRPDRTCGLRLFALSEEADFASSKPATVFVFLRSLQNYGPDRPFRLALGDRIRPADAGLPPWLKAMSHYAAARIAVLEARRQGFDDVVFLNERGRLTETSRASLLLLEPGRILAPAVDEGVLPSVTRQLLRRACEAEGRWRWEERAVTLNDLARAGGAVLCSSSLGVAVVSRIGPVAFADLAPAHDLAGLFEAAMQRSPDLLGDVVEELPLYGSRQA